jgi:hypothetical protein
MTDYNLLSENFQNFFLYLYKIGFVIVTPTICVIGLILNVLCFIVCLRLKERIFFYFAFKLLAELIYLICGAISPYISCEDCQLENTYLRAIVTLVINKYLKGAIYTLITLLEIEISFNRYYLINSHSNKTIVERKDKLKMIVYILISLTVFLPYVLGFEIKKKQKEVFFFIFIDEYKLGYNKFGSSIYFNYFYTYFGFFENILSIVILIPLNIIILIKFKKFIKNKSNIPSTIARQQENAKSEKRFTRMMVLISFLFIISRLAEASVLIFSIYNYYAILMDYFEMYLIILNIFVETSTYLMFSLNFFILYFLNKTFRLKFKQTFCFK